MTARGGVAALWIQALVLGFALALAPAVTVLVAVLLMPGIIAWHLDAAHGRPMGRAVLAFGTAGAFAPVWHHIQQDQTLQGAMDTAINSSAIVVAWGLAGTGWLIGRTAQFAIELYFRSEANDRIRQLGAHRHAWKANGTSPHFDLTAPRHIAECRPCPAENRLSTMTTQPVPSKPTRALLIQRVFRKG